MDVRDRIKELRRVRASELLPHPLNWRQHPKAQFDALSGVLAEIGFADAVIARETPDGLQLINGHLRRSIMGDQTIPVLVVDLDDDEAAKMLITYDPLAALAETNENQLRGLMESVRFEDDRLWNLLNLLSPSAPVQPATDPGPAMDRAEELREKWGTQLGQVWEIGRHRVLCADCTATPFAVEADVAWVDPPYGVNYVGKTDDELTLVNDRLSESELAELWKTAFCNIAAYVKGDLYVAAPAGPPLRLMDNIMEETPWERHQWLVWVKDRFVLGRSNYHYRHEQIWYGWHRGGISSWQVGRDKDSVFEVERPSRSAEHPTMKPVDLVAQMLVNSSPTGGSVIDPFLGSGTTMVAAEQLGRTCYGMEIDPKYVAVTLERMAGMGLTPRLVS